MDQTGNVRYLTIVRHAEATPAASGVTDFDRALSPRGRVQCNELRAWAEDLESLGRYGPTTALVSAAARTAETFERAFKGTAFVHRVEFSRTIYNGRRDVSPEDLLFELVAIDPVTTSLMVVAHNPTVLELMFELAAELPHSLRKAHYWLAGAYVVALPDDQPVGARRCEVVASFLPG